MVDLAKDNQGFDILSRYIISMYDVATVASPEFKKKRLTKKNQIIKKIFLEDISALCGTTDTPVLEFWWCLPWVLKPGWIICLCASLPVWNGISGVSSADQLAVGMEA